MTQDPRSQGHLRRPATAPSSTTLPSTSNTLNAKDRAELVRRTRKLEQMLGVAMHIVDDSSKPKPSPLPLQSSGVMISTSTSVYVDSVDDDDTSDSGHGHSYAQPITPSSAAPVLRTKRSLILTQPRCSIDAPVLRLQPPEVDATSECNDHHGRDRSGSVTTITTISTVDSLDCNDTLSPLSPKSIKSRFRSRRPVSLPPSPSSPMSFDDKIEADKLIHQRQVFTASKLRLTLGENIPVELVMKTGAAGPYDLPPNKKSTHKSLGLFHHCKSSKDVSKHGVKGDPKAPLSSKSALGEQGRHPTAATLNVPIVKRKELNEVLGVPQSEMERLHARRAAKMAQKFGTPPPSPLYHITNYSSYSLNLDKPLPSPASGTSSIRFSSPASTTTSFQFTNPAPSPPVDLIFPLRSPSFSARTSRTRYSLNSTMSLAEEYAQFVAAMEQIANEEQREDKEEEQSIYSVPTSTASGSVDVISFGAVGSDVPQSASVSSIGTVRDEQASTSHRRRTRSISELVSAFLASPMQSPSLSICTSDLPSPNSIPTPLTAASDTTFTASMMGNTGFGLQRRATKLSKFFGATLSPESVDGHSGSLPAVATPPSPPRLLRKKSIATKLQERVVPRPSLETHHEAEGRPSLGDIISRPSLNLIRQVTGTSSSESAGRASHESTGKKEFVVASGVPARDWEDSRRWSAKNPKEVKKVLGTLREMKMKA